ncbi:MAG: hypothetical protein ACKOAX_06120, partial [Candidatus Kapaibacterium sp.]
EAIRALSEGGSSRNGDADLTARSNGPGGEMKPTPEQVAIIDAAHDVVHDVVHETITTSPIPS